MQIQCSITGIRLRWRDVTFTVHFLWLLVALCVISTLLALGTWQLHREAEKRAMLAVATAAAGGPAQSLQTLPLPVLPHTPIRVSGHFLPCCAFVVENRYYHHQLGRQIIQVFQPDGDERVILVDRGWLPNDAPYAQMILANTPAGSLSLEGFAHTPSNPFKLNNKLDSPSTWPLRLQQMDLPVMREHLSWETYPFIIVLPEKTGGPFKYNFETVSIPPERHHGYAMQWFSFAAIATIAFASLSIKRTHPPARKGR